LNSEKRTLVFEVKTWELERDTSAAIERWQFTTADPRIMSMSSTLRVRFEKLFSNYQKLSDLLEKEEED
jgi:hypothetical protein